MNNNRPRIVISVFIFNPEGDKILIGKKYDDSYLSNIGARLEYGEKFEDCATRILSTAANILVTDSNRIKFICSHNVVDKARNTHIVSVDYFICITKEEEKTYLMMDPYYFQSWNWYSWEEVQKMYENLCCGLQKFIKKFNIQHFDDIRNLVSN